MKENVQSFKITAPRLMIITVSEVLIITLDKILLPAGKRCKSSSRKICRLVE